MESEIRPQRRAEIEDDLSAMADDLELQAEAEQIERELAPADDEARGPAIAES